ncbi:hypothetical protein IV417_10715 [Alphaproteobacteria bacterium KMM 3653]|uniref:Uncharacterized protein n=1 Tax=Harenicola maris TaxID=2841044 RepID=A0AAP2CPS4_9RHOB|nr:hypothetical protein [Harenicola maris]
MAMKLRRSQIEQPLLADRAALVEDIIEHLEECLPKVVAAYPLGYLQGIVNESIKIALDFNITDTVYLRMFTDLRWRIAPGWYKQPQINAVLADRATSAEARFDILMTPRFDSAWEEACDYEGPQEWRGHLWEPAQHND